MARGLFVTNLRLWWFNTTAEVGAMFWRLDAKPKKCLGELTAVTAIRPIKDGVIADFEVTEAMLKHFIGKAHQRRTMIKPRVVICVPNGITEVEKRAVCESAESAGAERFI